MAVSNTSVTDTYNDQLTSTLSRYMPKFQDQVYRGTRLLWWLNDKKRKRPQRGGADIRIPVAYGTNTTPQHFDGYDIVDITPQTGLTMAVYNWKAMTASISISETEELKNEGQYKLLDLLGFKVEMAEKAMKQELNEELHGIHGYKAKTFTGGESNTVDSVGGSAIDTGYKSFNSLDNLVRQPWGMINPAAATARSHTVGGIAVSVTSDGGGSYAGWGDLTISAQTNGWWMNQTNPGFERMKPGNSGGLVSGGVMGDRLSTAQLTYAGHISQTSTDPYLYLYYAMLEMYARMDRGDSHTDLILSSPEVYNIFEMASYNKVRYQDTRLLKIGFENQQFKGATIMSDPSIYTKVAASGHSATAPAVPMYFLNSDNLWWVVHPSADFAQKPFVKPENQLARTAQIVLMAQLCCDNRANQGVISIADMSSGWSATT